MGAPQAGSRGRADEAASAPPGQMSTRGSQAATTGRATPRPSRAASSGVATRDRRETSAARQAVVARGTAPAREAADRDRAEAAGATMVIGQGTPLGPPVQLPSAGIAAVAAAGMVAVGTVLVNTVLAPVTMARRAAPSAVAVTGAPAPGGRTPDGAATATISVAASTG